MEKHWLILIMGGLILVWAGSLILVRQWTKRKLMRSLAAEALQTEEYSPTMADPRPEDQAALEIIRTHRRRYLMKLWPDSRFSFKLFNELALSLIPEIAAVYYPNEGHPELKASLADLVGLYNRVGVRLQAWLDTLPVRAFKDVELETVLRYHEFYQTVKNHPGYLFLKRHHLDKVGRWAWTIKNFASPWYWGRRVAYAGGKEVMARLLLARVAAIVGEEAMRLYGRGPLNSGRLGRYQLAVQEMINLALENGHCPPVAANYILKFVLKARGLDDQEKLILLRCLGEPKHQAPGEIEGLDASDQEQLFRWLKSMVTTCWSGPERSRRLAELRNRWPT
ncbi:MAG: hypothetical protein ACLFUU_00865 [Desulfobacteraceae bacterium]